MLHTVISACLRPNVVNHSGGWDRLRAETDYIPSADAADVDVDVTDGVDGVELDDDHSIADDDDGFFAAEIGRDAADFPTILSMASKYGHVLLSP